MFGKLRLQLTLFYVGALAVTLLVVGGLVYWLVARSVDAQVNTSLSDVNHLAAEVLAQAPPRQDNSGPGGPDDEGGEEGEGSEADEYSAALASTILDDTGDVLPVVLDHQGLVIANPRDLPVEQLPTAAAIDAASSDGSDRRDANIDGNRVRILTQEVQSTGGGVAGYVMTLKSLEERDQDLQQLLTVLLLGGAVGLLLAGAGGFWVGTLAIKPVRRSFERQREFIADASHELRTPLTVVRMNAESLLGKAPLDEREALDDIVEETEHMGRLVSDLLTLAQADRSQLELQIERVDLFGVVRAVERAGQGLARDRGIDLVASAEHVLIDVDAGRLREALLILIDNAVRYTPSGGTVKVTAERLANQAVISVADTGIGIDEQDLGRVFDRFYRVDKARGRTEGSLGLGLSIARSIITAHGGNIEIKSEKNQGTTVLVVLQAVPSNVAAAAPSQPIRPTGEQP